MGSLANVTHHASWPRSLLACMDPAVLQSGRSRNNNNNKKRRDQKSSWLSYGPHLLRWLRIHSRLLLNGTALKSNPRSLPTPRLVHFTRAQRPVSSLAAAVSG
ncbi:hypothetical protein Q8A73_011399 [Channa argus]|nr:hypothetical protein Q8A73_011399 [Channa argus]